MKDEEFIARTTQNNTTTKGDWSFPRITKITIHYIWHKVLTYIEGYRRVFKQTWPFFKMSNDI